ncbi:MAG: aspartate aminotransferase family protein [Gemmatimonadetes bacterium]|nr:aspartate aminotransferase family protein [Gemmatimonadota bacterium]
MAHRYPESHVLYRKFNRHFPVIVRGKGCTLWDDTGKAYLDGSGGAYVCNLGHGVTAIADAVSAQMREVAYVTGMQFTNPAVEALAAEMAALSVGDLDKFLFLTSGADATEAALKLARQHWVARGRPSKHKILALAPAYHGHTMLALSAGARPAYRAMFGEWMVPVVQVPAPYAYRCACDGAADCPRCTGTILEEVIAREGADSIAVFIGETVGGSSTGASVPRDAYWRTVREICTRHDILWVADEVLVGAGRTGTWTAVEPYGAVPDIMTMGKGISARYAPLAAVVTAERVLAPIAEQGGGVLHAQTYAHTPMMCAAGVATVRYVREHDLLARCRAMGARLHAALAPLRDHPLVGDVRGRGLLAGIELVADRATRAPFPRAQGVADRVADAALAEGLVCWPHAGGADGVNGDVVCLAPPFVVSDAELLEMVARLERALERVAASRPGR